MRGSSRAALFGQMWEGGARSCAGLSTQPIPHSLDLSLSHTPLLSHTRTTMSQQTQVTRSRTQRLLQQMQQSRQRTLLQRTLMQRTCRQRMRSHQQTGPQSQQAAHQHPLAPLAPLPLPLQSLAPPAAPWVSSAAAQAPAPAQHPQDPQQLQAPAQSHPLAPDLGPQACQAGPCPQLLDHSAPLPRHLHLHHQVRQQGVVD